MLRRHAALILVTTSTLGNLPPAALSAREDPAGLCLAAAARAADQTGVPYDVLLAISTVETGRNNRPWPWTVNFGGDGHWFDTAAEAEASVADAVNRGVTNVDLGCFQLNYRWHAEGFGSISDMLDPDRNALYAAEFLADHFAETGDWALAAAAYHSATPEHAETYQAKFEAVYASLSGAEVPSVAEPRVNRFPLLLGGNTGTGGSLVPQGPGGLRLIGGS
jgi:hypothetical protein